MLQNRGYVELRAKALRPLERGQLLSTMLVAHLGQFVEPAFTSRLESDLDAISAGELDSTSFLAQWSVPSLPPSSHAPFIPSGARPHLRRPLLQVVHLRAGLCSGRRNRHADAAQAGEG